MKFITNNLKLWALTGGLLLGLASCEKEDYDMMTAEPPVDANFMITNTVESDYFLSSKNSSDVAVTMTWNPTEFDVPSPVKYAVEGSVNEDFSTIEFSTVGTEQSSQELTVGDLLKLANAGGMDSDPETTDEAGNPNNAGTVYLRVRAFLGEVYAVNNANAYTDVISTSVEVEEGSGITITNWGLVGSAVNDWGGTPDVPLYDDGSGVLFSYVYLKDGEMKIRENNAWDTNFGDTGADGTLDNGGDNIAVTEGRYKVTVDFNSNTYSVEPFTYGIVGSAWNDWGGAGPDAPFYYDYTTNTFKAGVKLLEGEMKVRFNNDWGLNYGDSGADGTLDEGGDNIVVTEGFYLITINMSDLTIDIQENAKILGVVGSAYNDWGATADAYMTEIQPGVFYADGVNLLTGEMKFRFNESWDENYGDTGADGTLDNGGDNIAVTEGIYRVTASLVEGETATYTVE